MAGISWKSRYSLKNYQNFKISYKIPESVIKAILLSESSSIRINHWSFIETSCRCLLKSYFFYRFQGFSLQPQKNLRYWNFRRNPSEITNFQPESGNFRQNIRIPSGIVSCLPKFYHSLQNYHFFCAAAGISAESPLQCSRCSSKFQNSHKKVPFLPESKNS